MNKKCVSDITNNVPGKEIKFSMQYDHTRKIDKKFIKYE